MFSFNLRYLSPRSYEYIRKKFDNHLPHSTTIRKWFAFSNASGNGGIIDAALQTLKKMVEEHNEKIFVALSFDEMSIRSLIQYQHFKKRFSGFINFGTKKFNTDVLPIATNALVFMLNGINVKMTVPIAYYFITTLIAEEKAVLIASIIKTLTSIGIRVASVTSDGLITNFASYGILGADFADENITPYFINTDDHNKVYIFHDPPHVIKLVRNCLGDEKMLYDGNERKIEWKFIERLYRSNTTTHKLTKKHIHWKSIPMNVKVAVQTISNSVAESIDKLAACGVEQFSNTDGTVEFLKNFDKLFNIFNSDKKVECKYKSPICNESKESVFRFMDYMLEYIDGLTLLGKPITKTVRNTPFIGFKSNIVALKMMWEELVESKVIDEIKTTSIQQDYLESFFGRVRSSCGNNTNPSQEQFAANFRRTLVNRELTCSAFSNCIDKLDILTVSSSQLKATRTEEKEFIMVSHPDDVLSQSDENEDEFLDQENAEEFVINSPAEHLSIANIAGTIEAMTQKNRKFNCNDCSCIFESNNKIDSSFFVKHKKNTLPCQSTYDLCDVSNRIMSEYFNQVHESLFDYDKLFGKIKSKIKCEDLFTATNFEHDASHRTFIVDLIVDEFIRIRAIHRAREMTLNQYKAFVRSTKTHSIHFCNQ